MIINQNIKKYRNLNNLSQQDLAESLFISRQAVSKWENGSSVPDIKTIKKLADLFEITTDELMGEAASIKSHRDVPFKLIYGLVIMNLLLIGIHLIFTIMFEGSFIQFFLLPGMLLLMLLPMSLIFIYALINNDYSLIAGYNPKKQYNLGVLRKSLLSILLMTLVGSIAFLLIYSLIYVVEGLNETPFAIILLLTFSAHLFLTIIIINLRYKGLIEVKK